MGLLGDLFDGAAKIVGTVVGTAIGISAVAVGLTLGVTGKMVDAAREAGCETYEEIKDFCDENF